MKTNCKTSDNNYYYLPNCRIVPDSNNRLVVRYPIEIHGQVLPGNRDRYWTAVNPSRAVLRSCTSVRHDGLLTTNWHSPVCSIQCDDWVCDVIRSSLVSRPLSVVERRAVSVCCIGIRPDDIAQLERRVSVDLKKDRQSIQGQSWMWNVSIKVHGCPACWMNLIANSRKL